MYTYTTGFQPSNWSVVSTLIPHTYPCPNQSDIPSLYDDVIIFFYNYCIYSLCSHKAVCFVGFFFLVFFSVLVLVLFSNEYPPLNMLNLYSTSAKANKYIVIGRRTI